jgi:hypothetical protein
VDQAGGGFTERDDARVETVHQRAEGKEIQGASAFDVESVVHEFSYFSV